LDRTNFELVLATAQAGEMLGNKLIYLEGGSGAKQAVPLEMIDLISKTSKYHQLLVAEL
jgi:putative glycerol-1-phosphate prenyltransferase